MMIHLLLSLILSIEIIVMTDFIMVLRGIHFKLSLYGLSMLSLFILLAFVVNASSGIMLAAIMTILMIPCIMYLLWLPFARSSRNFEDVDNGKAECYGGKKVMLIVPHQDDEINVLGGVLEEYLKYGSEVYIVYAIVSGTFNGVRYREALNLCKRIGIPEGNITFLGYGFMQGRKDAVPPVTKGTREIPAYREGQACTRENMVNDLVEIISSYKPDVIYGSDYDYHGAHHLTTIVIDEALGKVLKEQQGYRPVVLKSYAYRTTWESYPDYYETNIRSTKYMKAAVETYPWEERLRLPIAAHMLNRSLLHSEIFQQYKTFKSQGAVMRAINFNTDKVVWQRRTDSLLLNAKMEVSSGNGDRLNDFLLYDKKWDDILKKDCLPNEGLWIPDNSDKLKSVTIRLSCPSYIEYMMLYQFPVSGSAIEEVSISFNDEKPQIYPLKTNCYPTQIKVKKDDVDYIVIRIVRSRGNEAGLSEIEAFDRPKEQPFSMVKVMNAADDFVYDYWLNVEGCESFSLYTIGNTKQFSKENYSVTVYNPHCNASIIGSEINVCCPKNEKTLLTVESSDSSYSDTVAISNPDGGRRLLYTLGQKIETMYYDLFIGDRLRKATTLSAFHLIKKNARKVYS